MKPTEEKTLIIIGMGPKAISIACKHKILESLGFSVPKLVIIEKNEIMANWRGRAGYTDGEQRLGTSPEKDVGFPYVSMCWGKWNEEINKKMMSEFSWNNYLRETNKLANWIDSNRIPPMHKDWVQYWLWLVRKFKINNGDKKTLQITDISKIEQIEKRWTVYCDNGQTYYGDGLVVTGPGHPKDSIPIEGIEKTRIMNGKNFFENIRKFDQMSKKKIGVIGGGETAASIAVGLLDYIETDSIIEIINTNGAPFVRSQHVAGNSLYSNPEKIWKVLANNQRREIIQHTDRRTISPEAMGKLQEAPNVQYRMGRVKKIVSDKSHLLVLITNMVDPKDEYVKYDYVIDGSGFDPLWFKSLLKDPDIQNITQRTIESKIKNDLSVEGITPRLHLPMLAGYAQGPGMPNLGCLGIVADRILSQYTMPPK